MPSGTRMRAPSRRDLGCCAVSGSAKRADGSRHQLPLSCRYSQLERHRCLHCLLNALDWYHLFWDAQYYDHVRQYGPENEPANFGSLFCLISRLLTPILDSVQSDLSAYALTGSFPASISALSSLTMLYVTANFGLALLSVLPPARQPRDPSSSLY